MLIGELLRLVGAFPELRSAADLFSGTSRVAHALKRAGYAVQANDHNGYAHALATCYVQADRERWARPAALLIAELNRLPGEAGYFTETFCIRSRFLQPENGARVDAIREAIARKALDPELEAILLVSLMEAADRVDSTCGLQMAYVKRWAPRSYRPLELRLPALLPAAPAGPCRAHQLEANEAARQLEADLVYLDPPYNQHSYLSNYHVWESLVLWDKPEVYGVACKRIDCKTRKSPYNRRTEHVEAFADLVGAVQGKLLIVSFSDEGYQSREQLEAILRGRGEVHVIEHDFKRYVGAQIGIHSPQGKKVGKVGKLRNKERIYLVGLDPSYTAERIFARIEARPAELSAG